MDNTTNYNLRKPGPNDFYSINDQNTNMDIIDGAMHTLDQKATSYSALVTLLAASWSNDSYTLTNEYITATNVVEMLPAEGITADQLKAAQKANIVGGTQTAGSMSLIALGTVPTIDIPVKFVFRGDL